MDKTILLEEIKKMAAEGNLTQPEITAAFEQGVGVTSDLALTRHFNISEILYYIGGAIVFLGISVLIFQNWEELTPITKILATFGSGLAAYLVGVAFSREQKFFGVAQAFFLISALVIPIGLFVIFDNAGYEVDSAGVNTIISLFLLAIYLVSYFVFRKALFILFSIIFGTWLFFSFTSFLVGSNPQFIDNFKFYQYRSLLTGLAYILIGYQFARGENVALSGFLYSFGLLGFLGSALALGGWSPEQNIFWELIFPGLVFATIFLSVRLKSKSFLTWGSVFLMIYILKITGEYFTEGLGWPFSLVLAGLALIAVGYYSVYLNKKYFGSKQI